MRDLLLSRSDVGEFRRRYKWMALVVTTAFIVVLGRLFQLQIVHAAEYAAIAHENIIHRAAVPTTRGVIRDSQGKVLASSRPSYNVHIIPGRVLPSARGQGNHHSKEADEPDTWPRIADALRLNPSERTYFEERIRTACSSEDAHGTAGGPHAAGRQPRPDPRTSPCWRAILVREDVPRDIVAELRQHAKELDGTEIVPMPVRYYPFKNLGAHMLGYISEIDAETLAKVRPPGFDQLSAEERSQVNPLNYEVGDTLGATGIEHAWESYLRGQRGWEKRVVDARGRYRTGPDAERLIDAPVRQDAIVGRDLRLTVDIELEQAIERAMRPHASGAVVVEEVRTGRILALYSKPDFDPNDLSGGSGRARVREAFSRLSTNALRPLLDKTVTGAFQPGSTFKPFSALAALEDNVINPDENERCDGYIHYGRKIFRCTHVHGKVNMREAIGASCNIYFAKVAEYAGMDRIAKMASEFGLGSKSGIGVNPESAGRIPTRAWYATHYRGQFRLGFTINTAIGQGATMVTPLQLALAYGAIANGGTLYSPQIVRAVETSDGSVVQDFSPRVRQKVNVRPENLARIFDGLYSVVNDPKGTAFGVRDPSLDVAGKTGTAQTGYVAQPNEDPKLAWYYAQNHAWFAAFAPSRAPEIAVVVLVEHGGAGPTQAAPVALTVVREYQRLQAARALASAPHPASRRPSSGSTVPAGVGTGGTGSGAAVLPAVGNATAPGPASGFAPASYAGSAPGQGGVNGGTGSAPAPGAPGQGGVNGGTGSAPAPGAARGTDPR